MQKLDFVQHLRVVVDKLDSEQIIGHFEESMVPGKEGSIKSYNFTKVTPLLFSSKVNYESLLLEDDYALFLKGIEADKVYNEDNLARISRALVAGNYPEIFKTPETLGLYMFHKHLTDMLDTTSGMLLQNEYVDTDFETSVNEGVLLFQVVIDEEYISSEEYIKILTTLQELVNVVGKILINKRDDYQTDIVLLDSGSDANIGIQTFAEVAKAIFSIFKEVWDYITNHGIYQNEKKNKALLESLSIRKEIQKNIKEGVLTEEVGKEYMHLVKTRTDKLIGMKVLPKQIVTGTQTLKQTNRNLLEELKIKGFLNGSQEEGKED